MEKQKTALITGASKGLGYALAKRLAEKGWHLIITSRNAKDLLQTKQELGKKTKTIALSGDVRDEVHLLEIADELDRQHINLDLLINNASALGVSPMKSLLEHPVDNLHKVFHTNMIAPVSLLQKVHSYLNKGSKIINVSSDAAVEHYESWGAYGGSKAGLDHMTMILAKENPGHFFYAFDPGDMRTDMHQAAFPGEDISDRPLPQEFAVPALVQLIETDLPSGRYSTHSFNN